MEDFLMKYFQFIVVKVFFLLSLLLLISCTHDTVRPSIDRIENLDPTNRSYQDAYYEISPNFSEDIELRLINIDLGNILIKLKFTTYNSYIIFDTDSISKNEYLQINIERDYTDSLKDINKKIRIFQQNKSDEGLIVFLSSSTPIPTYTVLMFNSTGIYHSYSFELQQYECNNFNYFSVEDGLIKNLYISQGKRNCDVKLISDEKVLPSVISSQHTKDNSQNNIKDINFRTIWDGKYYYSTYHDNEETGTGVGETTTITISNNNCFIDIVGYQADNHFECSIINKKNYHIDVISLKNNSKFAEIKHNQKNNYFVNITYYDDHISPDRIDNNFYNIEKLPL